MNNKETSPDRQRLTFADIKRKVRNIFIPEIDVDLKEPTEEQSHQVESALLKSMLPYANVIIEFLASIPDFLIEHSQADTRPEHLKSPTDIFFEIITGAWGRGPECEGEIKMLATAMGKKGLQADLISMPGHGQTSDIPKGWNQGELGEDFDTAADVVIANIEKNLKDHPDRPIVINAWSMGGVTALKALAKRPDLINGVILIDTPAFPQDFKKLALRFILYEIQKIRSVRAEKPFKMEKVKSPGLEIFKTRIRDRNKLNGISFKVLRDSARSLAKQDLFNDGTLDKIEENYEKAKAEGEKVAPILILRGSNDFVVPHEQTSRLYEELKKRGVDVKLVEVEATGHGLIGEQPIKSGEIVREWLEEKELIKN